MKKDVKNIFHDDTEPTVGSGVVYLPMWIVGLLGFLLYWGCNYVDDRGGNFSELVYEPYRSTNELAAARPGAGDQGPNGKVLYESTFGCAICHGSTGLGTVGTAPPLVGSEWVLGSPNRLIRIPLTGVTGPIKVGDNVYNMNMYAVGATLKDDELAAILTYIRSSWGNKASPITPEQVRKIRDELAGRAHPYTADELLKLSEDL